MQINKYTLLVALSVCFVTFSFSQHRRYAIKNGIGIQGGFTQYDIITDNFETTKGNGWVMGLNAIVDLPHKWYTVSYSMMLSENTLSILGKQSQVSSIFKPIDYKLMAVHANFIMHIKIIGQNLMFELGPQLQYNDKLELKDSGLSEYILNAQNPIKANEIEDISKLNFNGMFGISAGFGFVRLRAQYIHGFTNMLSKLNEKDFSGNLNEKFKGNQSMYAFTVMIVL